MLSPRSFALLAALLLPVPLAAQTPSRITAKIDDSALVALAGTVHPLAQPGNDRGALPDSTPLRRMQIVLRKSDAQQAALAQLLLDLHNPASPGFHQWLTPEQFGTQFGPSDADVDALSTWLASKGFAVTGLTPGRQTLEFDGTAGQFRQAFHSEIHNFAVASGVRHANSTEPEIPAALAPIFGGFVSLNNFPPRSPVHVRGKVSYDPLTHKANPSWTTGDANNLSFPLAPGDFAVQYDTAPLLAAGNDGTGQTIAVINISNVNAYLVAQYRKLFSLPASPLQVIVDGADPGLNGINNPDGENGFLTEAYLDVEMTGMAAPGAKIDLVIAGDTALSDGFSLASEHAVYNNLAPILSLSVEECELGLGSGGNAFYNSLWQQAAAQGITVIVASSDSGSAGCDNFDTQSYATRGQQVNGFASTPYNVAVGGTDFFYSNYATAGPALASQVAGYWNETTNNATPTTTIKGFIPEQPWNNSQYGLNADNYYQLYGVTSIVAGSGGPSTCGTGSGASCAPYAKPAWQAGAGVPADKARDLPDVSLFAANGFNFSYYPICDQDGDCQPVAAGGSVQFDGAGGTSASAPAFAGIMALVTQKYGRQGQANYILYPLAAQFPAAFHDVTVGANTVPCLLSSTQGEKPVNCIAVANPITVTDQDYGYGSVVEGEIGSGTTAGYNATPGYDLATGLGSVDASVLLADWARIAFAGTTTTLTPSATSFAHGTAITLSGKVTSSGAATPTGQVALLTTDPAVNSQGLTDYTLASGSFSATLNSLPGGTYSLYGRYAGDTLNAASSSTPVSVTVTPETSATALVPVAGGAVLATGATVSYGTPVGLEAIPAPTALLASVVNCDIGGGACPSFTSPTGTVIFTEIGLTPSTVTLTTSGEGFLNDLAPVGSHAVSAAYSGDASYSASSSSAATFTVSKDAPALNAYKNSYGNGFRDDGGAKTFTFLVANSNFNAPNAAAPTGSITFTGGPAGMPASAPLTAAISPLNGSAAAVATVVLPATTPAGSFTVSYSYAGDPNYSAASSTYALVLATAENPYPTTIAASVSAPSSTPGTAALITAAVTGTAAGGTPTGYFVLFSDGQYYNSYLLPTGTGTSVILTFSADAYLFAGGNVITIEYLPDGKVYQASETTVNVTRSAADFTLQPVSSSVSGAGTLTGTVNLNSTGGFTGPVTLSCAATGSIGCSVVPGSVTLASGGTGSATLTLNTIAVAATGNYTAVITGTDATGQYVHTATVSVAVNSVVPSSFSIAGAVAVTIATPGASATTGLTLTPTGAFAGSVALSCALTSGPSGYSKGPTCTVTTPVAVTLGTPATATLTIASSPQTRSQLRNAPASGTTWLAALGGVELFALFFAVARKPRRRLPRLLAILLALTVLGAAAGCGGGGNSGGTLSGGTTSGSYVITVTGTSGAMTASVPVAVTVN